MLTFGKDAPVATTAVIVGRGDGFRASRKARSGNHRNSLPVAEAFASGEEMGYAALEDYELEVRVRGQAEFELAS